MKRAVFALLLAGLAAAPLRPAHADEATDAIDRSVDAAMKEGRYTFCKKPRTPLFDRQRDLCTLSDLEGCEGFAEACRAPLGEADPASKSSGSKGSSLSTAFASVAQVLLYLLVAAIVVAIAIPIISALLKARRNKKLADRMPEPARAIAVPVEPPPVELEDISDAEAALRMAEDHRRRGEHARALGLYLAASLTALDRRGAIRIAKHRTNGEYVRFCTDETSKPPLREIVREVDKVQFGKLAPTEEAVTRVAARATALVRQAATMALLTLVVLACGCAGGGRSYDDPAGDELPLDILKRHGFDVAPLGRSLASVPIPKDKEPVAADEAKKAPEVVVVDVDRVPLSEEETQAHLMRWVEEGGVLVLFGSPSGWPKDLGAKSAHAAEHEIVLEDYDIARGDDDEEDDVDDRGRKKYVKIRETRGRAARPRAVTWSDATTIGKLGPDTYVARKVVGKGVVIGVANDDLFTNVGVLPKHNGAILVGIMRLAARDARVLHPENATAQAPATSPQGEADKGANEGQGVRVRHAKREDAVPPPSTPFAALLAAGLGKGTWHALAAAILLFLAFGIRHARPRLREPHARRAFAEHVEATGAFWGRAKALPHALAAYGRFVEMRLRERIPRGADPVAFLATRSKADPDHVARLYERATKAKDDDEVRGDELETIKELRLVLVKALEANG